MLFRLNDERMESAACVYHERTTKQALGVEEQ